MPTSGKIVMLYKTSTCLSGLQNSSLYWDGFRSYFPDFGPGYLCFLVGTRFVGTALTHKARSVTFCILGGILTQFEGGVMGILLSAAWLLWSPEAQIVPVGMGAGIIGLCLAPTSTVIGFVLDFTPIQAQV